MVDKINSVHYHANTCAYTYKGVCPGERLTHEHKHVGNTFEHIESGKEQVIVCFSQLLSETERKYSTLESGISCDGILYMYGHAYIFNHIEHSY